jgi:hypothetical protein
LLQLTANGSPQAVPPSWQQAWTGRLAVTKAPTQATMRSRAAIDKARTRTRESWTRTEHLVPAMKRTLERVQGQEMPAFPTDNVP